MKFLKTFYLNVWIPLNFYFSVLYGQVAQVKLLAEIMVILGLGWLYFTGHTLTHKQLLGAFCILFIIGAGIGYWLVKLGVPQKGNKLGNAVNPQMVEIIERLKKIEDKL